MIRSRPVALALALAATAPALPAQEPTPARLTAAVDSFADSLVGRRVVGFSVAVTRGPELVLARGYGLSDRAAGTPATAETRYQIGSVTKQFTAATVMRLAERGKLSIEAPITRYLPDFPTRGHRVTIHQLLTHTSGIRSYTDFLRLDQPYSQEAVYDSIKAQPFDFAPGTDWRYDNSGYFLLGLILEKVTGKSYAELLEEELFRPLGLSHTGYCGASGTAIPVGYRMARPGSPPDTVPPTDMHLPFAAGGLCSTAPDLARWEWLLASGQVVRPSSYRQMIAPTRLTTGRMVSYGFGLVADSLDGHLRVQHGGGIPGFVSSLSWYPEDSTAVAILINTETNASAIAERIGRLALGLPLPVIRDLPTDSATRARFTGTYRFPAIRLELKVFQSGDSLMAQGSGQPAFRLLWQGGEVFRAGFDTSVRLEFTTTGNRVSGVTLYQGGAIQGTRVGPE